MADKDQTEEEKAIEATRERRKAVADKAKQPSSGKSKSGDDDKK